LNKQKDLLKACNKDIQAKLGEQKQMTKDINNIQLQLQELQHNVTKSKKESEDAARLVGIVLCSVTGLYHWTFVSVRMP